jgi:hypothetical protein
MQVSQISRIFGSRAQDSGDDSEDEEARLHKLRKFVQDMRVHHFSEGAKTLS